MRWARGVFDGRTVFGAVDGESLQLYRGDLFGGAEPTGESVALADLAWLPPCTPRKFLALWSNSRAAAAKNGWAIPAEPLYFAKAANSYAGHEAVIPVPAAYDGRVAYEGELGIVIGRTLRDATIDEARAAIFGFTCVNDVTAMELIGRDPSFPQWTRAKSFDGFGVFGPAIVTGLDPSALTVRTLVNGRERQNYPVEDLIFEPAALVSLISRDATLEPGDLIACGTGPGVLPMRPGTTVEVLIDGVGVLRNTYGEGESR